MKMIASVAAAAAVAATHYYLNHLCLTNHFGVVAVVVETIVDQFVEHIDCDYDCYGVDEHDDCDDDYDDDDYPNCLLRTKKQTMMAVLDADLSRGYH